MFELRTERLKLRPLKKGDLSNLMKIFSDPIAMKHYPSTKTEQQAEEWIEWTHNNYNAYNVGLWAVELLETGEFAGQCGIVPQKINSEVMMEIGYLFIREHWGKGYATEAALACLNYGFEKCRYPKLISLIAPENSPSSAVAKRIGMRKETQIHKWDRSIDVYAINSD
ncbi:GNAT family N-acetyltransferase [Alkalihalobacillus sp. TS-13]|uniref:GNAT family N-acetyltransferase n=1 Tax=Alkalihalobacillus sp. TS-13 TaxID=2842455 RepID=UPI001C877687|nr:GNAT family N-acetyltransferase [Alkalihalobacillus sp. TS-13]